MNKFHTGQQVRVIQTGERGLIHATPTSYDSTVNVMFPGESGLRCYWNGELEPCVCNDVDGDYHCDTHQNKPSSMDPEPMPAIPPPKLEYPTTNHEPKPTVETNPKAKYGATKPSVALVPSVALAHEALALEQGAAKYGGAYNWREYPVSAMTYLNAALRHVHAFLDGQEFADDSGVHHLGHARASLAIILDALENNTLVDDRPLPGKAAQVQDRLQQFKKTRI